MSLRTQQELTRSPWHASLTKRAASGVSLPSPDAWSIQVVFRIGFRAMQALLRALLNASVIPLSQNIVRGGQSALRSWEKDPDSLHLRVVSRVSLQQGSAVAVLSFGAEHFLVASTAKGQIAVVAMSTQRTAEPATRRAGLAAGRPVSASVKSKNGQGGRATIASSKEPGAEERTGRAGRKKRIVA